jgi:hypothetical protein
MIHSVLLLCFFLFPQAAPKLTRPSLVEKEPLEKSAYFAFVDHDFIFTIEVVKPGVPLLNFVSMSDEEVRIYAKDIRLDLGNHKVASRMLSVETGEFQHPMNVASMAIHPRSSFGVRLEGDFGDAKELYGATIRLGEEDLHLAPLSKFDFEMLVLKVDRLNLGSPDFRDDWRVLKLEVLGRRSSIPKRHNW